MVLNLQEALSGSTSFAKHTHTNMNYMNEIYVYVVLTFPFRRGFLGNRINSPKGSMTSEVCGVINLTINLI